MVIDTPETCLDCKFCFELHEGIEACCLLSDDLEDETLCGEISNYCQERPNWCPLKEIPKKKEPRKIHDNNLGHFHVSAFDKGYNKCIDELLQSS